MPRKPNPDFPDHALWSVSASDRDAFLDVVDAEERLLPSQFLAQPGPSSPERTLALAVLVQSLHDAVGTRGPWSPTDERADVQADALAWLKSDDTGHVFSFASIADLFGWDVGALRAGILARLEDGTLRLPRMSEVMEPAAKRLGDTRFRAKKGSTKPAAMRESAWARLVLLFGIDEAAYVDAWRHRSAREAFEFFSDEKDAGTLIKAAKVEAA